MKDNKKALSILYFICVAIWFVCLIFDIVEKDFSIKFFLHILAAVLSIISAFLIMKKNK